MATIVQQTNGEKTIYTADEYTQVQQKFNDIYNTQLPGKANATDLATTNAQLADIATVYARNFMIPSDTDWGQGINKAINSITSGEVIIPGGSLNLTTSIIIKSNVTIKGQGSNTVLKPQGCHAITCALNAYLNTFTLQDFNIQGDNNGDMTAYDNTRHGINLNSGSNNTYKGIIKNITISNCAGKGIYTPNAFSMEIDRVFVDKCGGNSIEVSGGPSFQISNCYVHNVASGKCAYRVYSGATLISCNGVDSGQFWGVFGSDTTTTYNDGATLSNNQYNVMLINCNIEAITTKGLVFLYQGRFAIHNSNFLVYSGLAGFEYYIDAAIPSGCFIDTASTFQTSSTSIHPSPFRFSNAYNFVTFNTAITSIVGADQTTVLTIPSVSYEYTFANQWMDWKNINIKSMNYYYHGGKQNTTGTAAPTSGTWNVGDKVWNTSPAASGNIGWVCVTAGTPGTWKTFGTIGA